MTESTRQGSRGNQNAQTHGLCSTMPDVLTANLMDAAVADFNQEYQPRTPTQRHLVREMARHSIALTRAESLEEAVLRRGAVAGLNLESQSLIGLSITDQMLAGAGTSDAIRRIARYRKSHERAFLKSMQALVESQATYREHEGERRNKGDRDGDQREWRTQQRKQTQTHKQPFNNEADCEAWMLERLAETSCRKCQSKQGILITTRAKWQCSNCHTQHGLRRGTIMERSRLNLHPWFQVILNVLRDPEISTRQLATNTNLNRQATLRRMKSKVLAAVAGPNPSEQLAGLTEA